LKSLKNRNFVFVESIGMSDLLVYWRDCPKDRSRRTGGENGRYWHSSAKCMEQFGHGDKFWVVTSGKHLGIKPEQAGFLVGAWIISKVIPNPGDDPSYPVETYRFRTITNTSDSINLARPIPVDHILRPADADKAAPIGRYLQGPRKLTDTTVRQLKSAAAGELVNGWLVRK